MGAYHCARAKYIYQWTRARTHAAMRAGGSAWGGVVVEEDPEGELFPWDEAPPTPLPAVESAQAPPVRGPYAN
jgi:hypothetical protein